MGKGQCDKRCQALASRAAQACASSPNSCDGCCDCCDAALLQSFGRSSYQTRAMDGTCIKETHGVQLHASETLKSLGNWAREPRKLETLNPKS